MILLHQGAEGAALRGSSRGGERDRLSVWCGWVLVGAAVLVPPLGYIAPLAYAPLLALVGLLCLPALRVTDEDRPAALILFAGLIWAAAASTWSPYHPTKPGNSTILKLAFELPLYWSAVAAARRADPVLRRRALRILAWGCAVFGLILLSEAFTRGALYKVLHAFYQPIRPDLAESNVGHATQVLGPLWPLAACGAPRRLRPWLGLAMFAGTAAAGVAFGYDATVLSLLLTPIAALIVWRWPLGGPRLMAVAAVALFLGAPLMVWAVRHFLDYAAIQQALPKTDSMRMGYWSHAIDWIRLRPVRGWGLEASRMFGPGIVMHPHNNPLQIWLELGGIGAVAAAAFWGVTLSRLSRPAPSLAAAATAACAAAYMLFGVNFGVWEEWWLAVGGLIAMMAVMNARAEADASPA
jgi:O-antigen ligase